MAVFSHRTGLLLTGLLINMVGTAKAMEPDILIAAEAPPVTQHTETTQISMLMQQARLPGQSNLIQQALIRFSKLEPQPKAEYWLLAADMAQQQHQFTKAKAALEQAAQLQQQPQIPLMQARIALVEAKPEQAMRYCKQLLALQELFLFELCSLEVAGRNGQTAHSYPLLQRIAKRKNIPAQLRLYLQAVLAEQAEQLQQPTIAAQHLQPWLAQAPVPMWLKWADLSMAIAPQQVYQQLSNLGQQLPLEDGLLLRLARAEQLLQAGNQHLTAVAERIALRERRQDLLHSADLTYFYLFLQTDNDKARRYAGINYQQAREPDDLKLAQLSGWTPAELAQLTKKGIL
jgi:hypothetical protein